MALLGRGLALCRAWGWGHVEKSENLLEGAGLFFLTGSGGLLFAWLVYRWQKSLGPHGSPHLHESLVGVIFRLQNGYRWLLPPQRERSG